VAVSGNSPQPAQNPNYGDEPKVSSGSPTYPLDVIATLTPDRKYLNIVVVNATEQTQKFDLSVTGQKLGGAGSLLKLTGSSLDSANHAGEPAQVKVEETPASSGATTVAPISVNIYRFPIQ
ncbi:MAG TPA: alpha-N-arabinofuranosidase, partial [Terracidiphilus sp.]|nr:alpha-N-arabinofuranosidase [Terracidiphilus sp.]